MIQALMTINDLAKYYNVDRTTIYRWTEIYNIPFELTPSGRRRYDLKNVKERVGDTNAQRID